MSTRKAGWYWVHLRYPVTVNSVFDDWAILRYSPEYDTWTECGGEWDIGPERIVEVNETPIEHSQAITTEDV